MARSGGSVVVLGAACAIEAYESAEAPASNSDATNTAMARTTAAGQLACLVIVLVSGIVVLSVLVLSPIYCFH